MHNAHAERAMNRSIVWKRKSILFRKSEWKHTSEIRAKVKSEIRSERGFMRTLLFIHSHSVATTTQMLQLTCSIGFNPDPLLLITGILMDSEKVLME